MNTASQEVRSQVEVIESVLMSTLSTFQIHIVVVKREILVEELEICLDKN